MAEARLDGLEVDPGTGVSSVCLLAVSPVSGSTSMRLSASAWNCFHVRRWAMVGCLAIARRRPISGLYALPATRSRSLARDRSAGLRSEASK